MQEKNIFILFISLFLLFYFLPLSDEFFIFSFLNGFVLLNEYAREHIITCLIPAFFIAGAINVFIKKDSVLKYLGAKSKKYVAYSVASVSGVLLAVCSCTILPLFAGIRKRGAGLGPATTFLFSGPAINVAAIFLTMSVLGYDIGLARIFFAIIMSILIGLIMSLIFKEKVDENNSFVNDKNENKISKFILFNFFFLMVMVLIVNGLAIDYLIKWIVMILLTIGVGLIAFFKLPREMSSEWLNETWIFTKTITPYLFIGVFIAGFIMPYLPQEIVTQYVGNNSIEANLIASIFGAFMYFSTLTEIPILQALISNGMNSGPALALLLAGPSLSLPNMLVIRKVLGNKKTFVYITLVIIFSTISGFLFGSF